MTVRDFMLARELRNVAQLSVSFQRNGEKFARIGAPSGEYGGGPDVPFGRSFVRVRFAPLEPAVPHLTRSRGTSLRAPSMVAPAAEATFNICCSENRFPR